MRGTITILALFISLQLVNKSASIKSPTFGSKVPASAGVNSRTVQRPRPAVTTSTSTDALVTKLKVKVGELEDEVSTLSTQLDRMNAKMTRVEQQIRRLERKDEDFTTKINELEVTNRRLQTQITQNRESSDRCLNICNRRTPQPRESLHAPGNLVGVDGVSQQIQELQEMVENVQRDVTIIVDQTGVDLDSNELHTFLGNREAVLLDPGFVPSPDGTLPPPEFVPTISPEDTLTPDQENILGNALFSLSSQNQELASKINQLEQEVKSKSTVQVNYSPEIEERLRHVETLAVTASKQANSGRQVGVSSTAAQQTDEEVQQILASINTGSSIFSVARSSHMIGVSNNPKEVLFDHTFASKGFNYNEQNGTFTTSTTGFYFITFTARTFDYKYFGVTLMKNSEPLAALFSDKHSRNVMQTQSIVAHLREGDRLWIRLPPSNKYAIDSDHNKMTTFTGFLIFRGDLN